jgi:hypothetical protein
MIITANGVIVYEGVRAPGITMPGGAYLRMINQRIVQDKVVRFEDKGRDRMGNIVAQVWVGDIHLNNYIPGELEKLGVPGE